MSVLRIIQGELKTEITFEKESSPLLAELLFAHSVGPEHPCGGRGICKKCTVRIKELSEGNSGKGTDTVTETGMNSKEEREVLSCQYRLTGDCEVFLPVKDERWAIEGAAGPADTAGPVPRSTQPEASRGGSSGKPSESGFGIAVDIGTTTVVLNLYDLTDGSLLASASVPNPQRSIAADVMGRIQACAEGKLAGMQEMITDTLRALLAEAFRKAGIPSACTPVYGGDLSANIISSAVITGNTTMLCLLTGTDPASMGKFPFPMPDRFGKTVPLSGIFFPAERHPVVTADAYPPADAYLPACMHAFVGADITCAVLASGLMEEEGTVLLADIGTNGELALKKSGRLYVTSTAAGPAFEGAGIVNGCGSIEGAIDHVQVCAGVPVVHTIGGRKAVGLCGSGLIDAVAAGLTLGVISETGVMKEPFFLADGIALYPEDVRSLQLAKAAVCAGIRTLAEVSGTAFDEIRHFYVAGGFGSHINVEAAGIIGLIPEELTGKTIPIGNAALKGASELLLHPELAEKEKRIVSRSEHVNLGGNPLFNGYYMDGMLFGEE